MGITKFLILFDYVLYFLFSSEAAVIVASS